MNRHSRYIFSLFFTISLLTNGAFSAPKDTETSWLRTAMSWGPDQAFKGMKWAMKNPGKCITLIALSTATVVEAQAPNTPYCTDAAPSGNSALNAQERVLYNMFFDKATNGGSVFPDDRKLLRNVLKDRARESNTRIERFLSDILACVENCRFRPPANPDSPLSAETPLSCFTTQQTSDCLALLPLKELNPFLPSTPSEREGLLNTDSFDALNTGTAYCLAALYQDKIRDELNANANVLETKACVALDEDGCENIPETRDELKKLIKKLKKELKRLRK